MTKQRVAAVLRQVGAIAAILSAVIPQVPMPDNVRVALVTVSGVILSLEHHQAKQTTVRLTDKQVTKLVGK